MNTDPRCTCRMPACPICSAPAHQPWQPKPGTSGTRVGGVSEARDEAEILAGLQRDYDRRQTIRRYLLVFLLTMLGGMIGGMISATTLVYYFN